MDRRLARSLAITVVITVLGGILLADRAGRLARQRRAFEAEAAADPTAASAAAAANPDSARIAATAVAAYDADRRARGVPPLAIRVVGYTRDSAGVLLLLFPRRPIAGQGAVIRVTPEGEAAIVQRNQ